MASSPLTLALLSGAGNNSTTDPALLAAMPRLNLAQSMMQEGLSAAPAYPLQALARLANAYVGNRVFDKGIEGLTAQEGQAAADAAATRPEGHPLRAALLSPNPVVRAQALQGFKTGLLQLSEPYTQSAGQERKVGGETISRSAAPQSPEGKLAADVSGASSFAPNVPGAQFALASALIKNATDNGVQYAPGPNGIVTAQMTPGYTPARAGLAKAIAGAEAGARYPYELGLENNKPIALGPEQQVNVNPNRVSVPGVQGLTFGGGATGGAVPQVSSPAQAAPAAAPATAATPETKPVEQPAPNGAQQIRYQGTDPALVRQQHEADQKEVEADRAAAIKSQQDLGNLTAIHDLMDRTKTGWGAETKLEASRVMKGIGVPDDQIKKFLDTNVADSQALSKLFTVNSAAAVRQMGAREPGSVIQLFRNAYQNLGTDPGAVNFMTNVQTMQHLRDSELANAKTNYLNESFNGYSPGKTYRGLQGFNETFGKTNAPEMYMHAAEAMSGDQFSPWAKIKSPAEQHAIISLIPKGSQFVGPDGKTYVKN